MPQIVDAQPFEVCCFCDGCPWFFQISPWRAVLHACNDVRIAFETWKYREDRERCRAEIDRLLAGFGVGKENRAALEINVLPLCVQNLAKPRPGKNQEPDCRRRERIELRPPLVSLWSVLRRWLRFIHLVGQADDFARTQRVAKPGNF